MPGGRRVVLCLWVICLVLGGSKAARAADWSITPSIETKAEYLSNIFYSPFLRKSDYIFTAGPRLAFDYATEATKLEGALSFYGLHYFQNSNLDRINQYYSVSGSTQATPRLGLSLGASFVSTSDVTEQLITTGILTNRRLSTSFSVSPGLTYNISERLSNSLAYTFYNVNYQSAFYNNSLTHTINDRLNYLLNEKTTLIASLTASNSTYQGIENSISRIGPQIGFSRKFNENWDMMFLGGGNISLIETNVAVLSFDNVNGFIRVLQQKQKTSNIAPYFTIGTNYRWENGGVNFSYNRDQSANAYDNQSQYNSFNLNFYQSITEKLSFNLNPYFYLSSIQGGSSNYSSNFIGIRPGLTYKLTERTSLGASYGFSYRTVTGTTSYAFPINDVWLTLNYSYPIHYQH